MSTGADCRFWETDDGQWFYKLQCWPYGDWPEYDQYGPFASYAKADRDLRRNHANPGGAAIERKEMRAMTAQLRIHAKEHTDREWYFDAQQMATCADEACRTALRVSRASYDAIYTDEEGDDDD